MEDTILAEAGPSTETAAASAADGTTPQPPDLSKLTLEQIDTIMSGGSIEVPVLGGGGETGDAPAPTPAAKADAPVVDKPPVEEAPAATAEEVVETRTPEEIEQAVEAARAQVVADGGDEAAQQAAADLAAQPQAAAEEVVTEAEVEEEVQRIQRPRLKNPVDQAIAAVFKAAETAGTPISWAEAERRVKGEPVKAEEPVAPEPPVDFSAAVTTIQGEVDAIVAELAGHEAGLFSPEVSKLTQQLGAKQAELALAKRDLQQAARAASAAQAAALTTHKTNRAKSHAQAIEDFPAVADDTSPLGKAVAKRVQELKNPDHPDHDILSTDSAPLIIARDVAAEMGIQPVARKKAAPPTAKVPAIPARKVVSPAAGNKTSVVPAKPAEDAKAQLETALHGNVSLADLDALQGMPDPTKLLMGAVR